MGAAGPADGRVRVTFTGQQASIVAHLLHKRLTEAHSQNDETTKTKCREILNAIEAGERV